ncbi:MAG: 16S rRNA (adenine(1518)-N(6)/adenine(1519)-N(6))-dimethyltransferase RsmA [Proteobacteria bacterium]|nr:16S rRNA (adenine(1518)-N(6)/adenine(1519)-N(6))-dimethyltransferase RsmA [Pseudomonadota bacterium]
MAGARFRDRPPAPRGRRAEPPCRRGRADGRRGRADHRPGHCRLAGRRLCRHRAPSRRCAVHPARPRHLRRGPVHVPRSGAGAAESARFRRGGQCHPRPADHPHQPGSWHRLRHCRQRPGRSGGDGRRDPHGRPLRRTAGRGVSPPALPPLREVIAAHGLSATKALGQNFLLDEQLLGRIAAIPGRLAGQQVLEVGPGPGGLTRALLRAGAQVTAIEMDRRCLPALAELAEAFPGQLRVIEGDALKVDHGIEGPFHVLANLPYNVGTQLFVRWLGGEAWPPAWQSLTLMFQQEVAERIVARPDSSAYGRLAVLAQWRAAPRIAMKVHRSAFTPPPKVMSAIIHVEPGAAPPGVSARRLERLTEAAFGQRRKMLRASLKGLPGALEALDAAGIDPARRAETLTVDDFVTIARLMDTPR